MASAIVALLATYYTDIRHLHIACVALSGTLFTSRALLRIKGSLLANHRALRMSSYCIDTTLLVAGILLSLILDQYPFVNGWLTAKLLLLPCYIGLGLVTLRQARSGFWCSVAMMSALLVYAAIITVAVTHRT
ncbi:MAG TPA: SirB2 family protein [Steroidobacteraceae bacterium]